MTSDHIILRLDRLYRVGAIASFSNIAIIPIQIIVFAISPPPDTVIDWFWLLKANPIIGLLNLDLLYLLNNLLLILIYLSLFVLLSQKNMITAGIALILGLMGITIYVSSNTAFEMLALSQQFVNTISDTQQVILLAAGEALIVKYEGTAFLIYYIFNAIALLMFSAIMRNSTIFTRKTAYIGMVAGVLMLVPSTFGTIGLIFAFSSLLPWALFSLSIGKTMLSLSRNSSL